MRDDLAALAANDSMSNEEKARACLAAAATLEDPDEVLIYTATSQTYAMLAVAMGLGIFYGPDGGATVRVR